MNDNHFFTFKSDDGVDIYTYKWIPKENIKIKGVLQICHGMAETAARYERFAKQLTENGYIVYIHDQRGHGRTAKTIENVGYLAEDNGFKWLVEDLHKLSGIIKKENPNLSLFLLGHSMGSFVAQRYIMLYGKELKGVIISGSNMHQRFLVNIGAIVAKYEVKKKGRRAQSLRMNNLSFGSYNNAFKPTRTEFDWLSRDRDEVDKYIKNPFCGTIFTAGFYNDFFRGLKDLSNKIYLNNIPKKLPIYIFSGAKDPVGSFGKGIIKLFNTYKKQNIEDVTYKLYTDGRHEMLNETNKEEVMSDVINWLHSHRD